MFLLQMSKLVFFATVGFVAWIAVLATSVAMFLIKSVSQKAFIRKITWKIHDTIRKDMILF